jgi:hypothetical protein
LTTSLRTRADRWQAASSRIVPMTLRSLIVARVGPALTRGAACTTVSTRAVLITLSMCGSRRSTGTYSTRVGDPVAGGRVSTPSTRSMSGSAASRAASRPPSWSATPVTRTTLGAMRLH